MKMEQTQCSETLVCKIQTPRITQKKAYNSSLVLNILWYPLILHKVRVFLTCLVRQTEEHLEIKLNANLMQLGNFINEFLARHVSGTYAHQEEH